jgi:hypothetical protein
MGQQFPAVPDDKAQECFQDSLPQKMTCKIHKMKEGKIINNKTDLGEFLYQIEDHENPLKRREYVLARLW